MDIASAIRKFLDEKIDFSDIHAQSKDCLRVRVHGDLAAVTDEMLDDEDIVAFLKSVVYEDTVHSLSESKGDMSFAFSFHGARFRCELSWQGGLQLQSMVLRRLNEHIPSFDEIGLPMVAKGFAERSKGLIIVTGRTGSGKSTTLASMIDYINGTLPGKVITIEDPIEYKHISKKCMITQREVGKDTRDFAYGLRAALRQDPDIIMVGEIRDKETVDAALSASETGHLVLATLHTPNAKQSVERITGFYEGEEKGWVLNVLSSVLIGVMSQVLVRRNGGGRRLACEVLVNTDAVAQMIRENKVAQLQNLIITGKNAGMITLNAVLADMARKNEISMQEALYAAYDIAELRKDLGLAHG